MRLKIVFSMGILVVTHLSLAQEKVIASKANEFLNLLDESQAAKGGIVQASSTER